jgi:hypothetical protein
LYLQSLTGLAICAGCTDAQHLVFGPRGDDYGRAMSEVGSGGSEPRRVDPVYVADQMGVLHVFAGHLEVRRVA